VTLIAAVNIIVGLLGGAALAVSAYVDFSQFAHPPKSPPAEQEVNPAQGAPRTMTPPPAPRAFPPLEAVIPRPTPLRENPYVYFRERQHYLVRQVVTYELYVMVLVPAGAILAVLLCGSGLGLFAMRPAGRSVSIWYALLAPLVIGASAAYTFRYVVPELRPWDEHRSYLYRYLGEEPLPETSVKVVYRTEAVALVFGVVYPLFLLGAMQLPSIRAALRPPPKDETPPPATLPSPEPVATAGA